MQFETKPQPVDAWKWTGKTEREAREFIAEFDGRYSLEKLYGNGDIAITAPDSKGIYIPHNHWLIKEASGCLMTCSHEQFAELYQLRTEAREAEQRPTLHEVAVDMIEGSASDCDKSVSDWNTAKAILQDRGARFNLGQAEVDNIMKLYNNMELDDKGNAIYPIRMYEVTAPTFDPENSNFLEYLHNNEIKAVKAPGYNEWTYTGAKFALVSLISDWWADSVLPSGITLVE